MLGGDNSVALLRNDENVAPGRLGPVDHGLRSSPATPSTLLRWVRVGTLFVAALLIAFAILGNMIIGAMIHKKSMVFQEMIYFYGAFQDIVNYCAIVGLLGLWAAYACKHPSSFGFVVLGFMQFVSMCVLFAMLNQCKKGKDFYTCKQEQYAIELKFEEHDAIAGITAVLFMAMLSGLLLFPFKSYLEVKETNAAGVLEFQY